MLYSQKLKSGFAAFSRIFIPHKYSLRRMLALITLSGLLMPLVSLPVQARNLIKSHSNSGVPLKNTNPNPIQPVVPVITATKTDALVDDVDGDNVADTGDTLKYTVTITNSGTMDALGVTFTDTLDPNTTLVPGSVTTTPVAVNDTYAASGNIQISINAGSGVLANDTDGDGNSLTASAGATSANGGNVSMIGDGSFTYNPPPGFEGTDTFTYNITDGPNSDSATVTINVSDMIWFINNTAGAGGDGRLTSPFNALTGVGSFAAVAADDPGDNIFLYSGAGDYNGGLTLLANQRFIGQGAGQSLSTITGITPPAGSLSLPSTGGPSPNIVSASNGINLGTDNLIRGLNIGNTTGAGISGSSFGTLTVREVAIGGTGQALNLSAGALDAVFNSLSSTNSVATGISLTGVSGSLVSGPTDVINSTGSGISASNSSAVLDFGATTVNGSGGTGVNLNGNTGNIFFTLLDIAPAAGQRGFLASVNSTGTITATSGTITTSANVAVEINGFSPATRTDLNMTLSSVSAINASHGIVLSNTSGSFSVTGDGATAGSGGTIQDIASRGASFIDATNISLNFMNLGNVGTVNGADPTIAASTCGSLVSGNNTGCNAAIHMVNVAGASFNGLSLTGGVQQGINGNNVTNFTLSNSQVINFGDQVRENGIQFKGLLGVSAVTNTSVAGNEADQMLVQNSSGTLTSLTLNGSSFSNSAAPNGNSGFSFSGANTANMSVIAQNSVFSNNRNDGFVANATDTSTMSIGISGSTFQNHANTGISISSTMGANTTFNISNNPVITGSAGNAININQPLPSTGSLQGTIANNVIGTAGVPGSGSSGGGSGMNIISNGSGSLVTAITNNAIHGITFGSAINIQARDGNNSLNTTVTGNTINTNSAGSATGILVNSGAVSTDTVNVCADISGNTFTNFGGDEIRVRRRFAGVTFRLPGFAGVGTNLTDVNNFLAGQNTLGGGTVSSTNAGAPGFVGGAACTAPIAMLRETTGVTMKQYLAKKTGKASPRAQTSHRSKQKDNSTLAAMKSLNHASVKRTANDESGVKKASALTAPRIANANMVSTIMLNLGTLPAGKSITITFEATINNSVPSGTTQVSNQGIVSGDNFVDVATDDPDVGGAADPTVTPIEAEEAPTISCPADITVTADTGMCSKSVSFSVTATGQPTPTVDCKIGGTSITSPHPFPVGTTTVMCTAKNEVDPDASCSFDVTVTDPDAPVITVLGANPMTVECHTTFTDPGATANDTCAGAVPVTVTGVVDANVVGTYTLTYTATDGTNPATATRTVNVVDTTAPVVTINGANPMIVNCGSTFTDPGATATDSCAGNLPVSSASNVNTNVPGTYTVTYTATDGYNTGSATRTVIVVDNGLPVNNLNGQSYTLWPPNHNYHTFNISQFVVSASDGCDGTIDINDVVIWKVTSDETENGGGDGNTNNDIVIAANCKSVQLRSERNGGGNGRVYTIHFRVTDSNGNVATATGKVKVPKSQGNNGGAVEDAPQYTVNGTCP